MATKLARETMDELPRILKRTWGWDDYISGKSRRRRWRREQRPTWRELVSAVFSAILLLAIAAYCFFISLHDYYLERYGAVVQGVIFEKGPSTSGARADQRQARPDYFVKYRFTTRDGAVMEATDSELSYQEWTELSTGGPVTVLYEPRWPVMSRPARHINWIPTIAGAAFGTLLVLLGIGTCVQVFRRWWKTKDLLSV